MAKLFSRAYPLSSPKEPIHDLYCISAGFSLSQYILKCQWLMKSTSLLHSESSLNAFSTRGLPNKSQFSLKWTPLVLLGRLTTAKVYSTEDPADSGLPTTQDNYLSVLPHRFLTVTSLLPHQNLTSSYYSYPVQASCYSPSEKFQGSHSVRF